MTTSNTKNNIETLERDIPDETRVELTTRKQARNYCWTLNNYTAEELESISLNKFRYLIYGKEIAPTTGTPHLQGYLESSKPITFMAIKEACPGLQRASFFVRKGTRDQARDYCLKDGQTTEYGNWNAGGQGTRTDWQQIWTTIKDGASFHDIASEYPEQAIKYNSGIKACIASADAELGKQKLAQEFASFKPNKWQHDLLMDIAKKPDHRKVIWIVDTKGGRGKSYLAKHLLANMNACYLTNCKTTDAAHAYSGQNIVVFDYSRSNEDRINYGIIEQIKNGLIFSPKYDSRTKVHAIPHVVCFSNFAPERSMLSADRWDIRELNDNSVAPIENTDNIPHQKDSVAKSPSINNELEQLIEDAADELELYGVDLSKDVQEMYTPDEDNWEEFNQATTPPCRSQVAIPLPEWYNMHRYFGLPKDLPTVSNVHISPAVQAAIEQLSVNYQGSSSTEDHLDTREAGNTGTASLTCPNNSPMSIEYQDYLAEKKLRYLIQHQNDDTDDEFTDCEDIYTSSDDI
ncbi:replication-associated protein [Crucivirus-224]|nr:replication-associated protein [Crucivirus-224]